MIFLFFEEITDRNIMYNPINFNTKFLELRHECYWDSFVLDDGDEIGPIYSGYTDYDNRIKIPLK